MGRTMLEGGWVITVDKPENLSDGMCAADVAHLFAEHLHAAALAWHREHPGLLVTEPDVW